MKDCGASGSEECKPLSVVEARTHFGAWAIVSSPLVLGFDLRDTSQLEAHWSTITNTDAIAVNQESGADTSSDTNPDTNTHTNTDTNTDTNPKTNNDTKSDTSSDTNPDPNTHTNPDTNPVTSPVTNTDTNPEPNQGSLPWDPHSLPLPHFESGLCRPLGHHLRQVAASLSLPGLRLGRRRLV